MTLRKLCFFLFLSVLFCVGRADDIGGIVEEIGDVVEDITERVVSVYKTLPEGGKFAVGAGAGFVGSRIAVNTAVSTVKFAGAAFITSEVLNYAGVFDNLSANNKAFYVKAKNSALKSVDNLRAKVRRRLGPSGIKNTIEAGFTTEKMATLGIAAGAFAGFML